MSLLETGRVKNRRSVHETNKSKKGHGRESKGGQAGRQAGNIL